MSYADQLAAARAMPFSQCYDLPRKTPVTPIPASRLTRLANDIDELHALAEPHQRALVARIAAIHGEFLALIVPSAVVVEAA